MRFLKWMTRSKQKELQKRIEELEDQNEILVEQLTKQNETLQDVVVCIRRLAEVDDAMYKDVLAIASVIGTTTEGVLDAEDYLFRFRKKEKDEYLN